MKIVVLDGYALNPGDLSWEKLERIGEVTVYDRTSTEDIVERIGDAEIIYTNKTHLTKEILEVIKNVRFIGVLATGYNVVDIDTAKEKGIVVSNIPTYGTQSVAQFTMALLLEICHHVGEHSQEVKKGAWGRSKDFCFWNHPLMELTGKNIGLIGMGRIGQETAKVAQAFGLKILAYDAHPKKELETDTFKFVELDELFENSDIISLHCPLFESTKGIINKNNIAKMKDGVVIINTSRGPLIDENDLAEALNSGKVGSAAVDVLSVEPARDDNPLMTAKNCLITPHIAWAPLEARERLLNLAIKNLTAFLSGSPQNVVNK